MTGMRDSLDSARNRKRYADTMVDSITAEDIGSFPDNSVASASQGSPSGGLRGRTKTCREGNPAPA